MTPQSHFIVAAPIRPERAAALERLLASMNACPGFAGSANALVPFGVFGKLHFARFVVLKDETLEDLKAFERLRKRLTTPSQRTYRHDYLETVSAATEDSDS